VGVKYENFSNWGKKSSYVNVNVITREREQILQIVISNNQYQLTMADESPPFASCGLLSFALLLLL
jgi:hypothetical protein